MTLSTKEKQKLKAKAHNLKPVVLLGSNGLTEAVTKEVERALYDHELIKVKVTGEDRDVRTETITTLCASTKAELVQQIGKIAILFKVREED